ncbi:hypothetical protein NUACC26_008110 [Scytonema sp. NUACC26]
MENCLKEQKLGLHSDRTSTHTFQKLNGNPIMNCLFAPTFYSDSNFIKAIGDKGFNFGWRYTIFNRNS